MKPLKNPMRRKKPFRRLQQSFIYRLGYGVPRRCLRTPSGLHQGEN
jgi:hypothetical protein